MGYHFIQRFIGFIRVHQLHQLYLIELVNAVEAAHILTVRPGFAAEARRVGRHFDGQVGILHDLVAVDVGYRHFRRRDEIIIILRGMVHLAFFIGQLPGAVGRRFVDQVRRRILRIAVAGIIVQEILYKRALQPGAPVLENGEAGAGNFIAQFKIDQVVPFSQLPVRNGAIVQVGDLATLAHFHVLFRCFAGRNNCRGQVRQLHQCLLQRFFRSVQRIVHRA